MTCSWSNNNLKAFIEKSLHSRSVCVRITSVVWSHWWMMLSTLTVSVLIYWWTSEVLTKCYWFTMCDWIRAKKLPLYYSKNIKEHQNWTLNARNMFLFSSDDFPHEQNKVIYIMQYLTGEPKEIWFWDKTQNYFTVTWDGFSKFLLDIIEDSVNHQLHIAQMYTDTVQLLNQSVHTFDSYLSTLKAQLLLYSEDHMWTHFFIKLRLNVWAVLTMY